jgi:hypothetical protein
MSRSCCSSATPLELIMKVNPAPDAMKPDFHGVRAHWNRGFMASGQVWRTRIVMLVVPV